MGGWRQSSRDTMTLPIVNNQCCCRPGDARRSSAVWLSRNFNNKNIEGNIQAQICFISIEKEAARINGFQNHFVSDLQILQWKMNVVTPKTYKF